MAIPGLPLAGEPPSPNPPAPPGSPGKLWSACQELELPGPLTPGPGVPISCAAALSSSLGSGFKRSLSHPSSHLHLALCRGLLPCQTSSCQPAHSGALLSPEALWLKPMQAARQGLWRKPGSRQPLWKRPASGSREVHSRFPHLLHVRTLVCCISCLLLPTARPRADRSPVSGCRSWIHDPGHQRDPAESLRGGGDPGRQR